MAWIRTIAYDDAEGKLKKVYDKIKGADNYLDNILLVHSLRPHTLEGHMTLYKSVLHHSANTFPKWYLELIGIYVSLLNQCDYCIEHHFQGLARQLKDEELALKYKRILDDDQIDSVLNSKEAAGLHYSRMLTLCPMEITDVDVNNFQEAGLNDEELLEINQVAAYFNYANRTVLGLGVNTEGDILGLSPNNTSDSDWRHSEVV